MNALPLHSTEIADSWYVAETLPRAEAQAERNLDRQGFTAFSPRFRKLRRHARRTEQVLAPLFPGYLFVRFDRQRDAWRSINGTTGIRRLVGPSTGYPQPVADDIVEALLARCDNGIIASVLPDLQPGDVVRVLSGPLADRLAVITTLDDKGRVGILLDILGTQTPIRVPRGQLAPR